MPTPTTPRVTLGGLLVLAAVCIVAGVAVASHGEPNVPEDTTFYHDETIFGGHPLTDTGGNVMVQPVNSERPIATEKRIGFSVVDPENVTNTIDINVDYHIPPELPCSTEDLDLWLLDASGDIIDSRVGSDCGGMGFLKTLPAGMYTVLVRGTQGVVDDAVIQGTVDYRLDES